ncbi:MAG: sugar phosphate isomerase/epimerase, partial [Lentisphaerae bacterium]
NQQLDATVAMIRDAGLDVPCLSSSITVCLDEDGGLAELQHYLRLCRSFGSRFIRVFGGKPADMSCSRAAGILVERLNRLGDMAAEDRVTVLLETHDAWTRTADVADIMSRLDHPYVGVLWDTHHPYRFAGEAFKESWENIGRWVRYTHVKDSVEDPSAPHGARLCLPGEGSIPLRSLWQLLQEKGYEGYFTLEWERPWQKHLPPPEIAFPRFVELCASF